MALVTGASGGIGAELARLLDKAGWGVILVGRDSSRLEATRRSLAGAAAEASTAISADLSAPGAAEALHAECRARGLRVELLANNAGSAVFGPAAGQDPSRTEAMLGLNVLALTSLCSLFGRDMIAAGSGRILNIGSMAGDYALPYFGAYAASKSYVHSFSLALRAELRGSGVGVTCVLPGYVRTGFDHAAGISSEAYLKFSESAGMSAAKVAAAGLRALEADRPIAVAGGANKVAAALGRLVPRSAMPVLAKIMLDRIGASRGGEPQES